MVYCILGHGGRVELAGTAMDSGAAASAEFCRPIFAPAALKREYAPVMELVDMRDLGAVTSVKNYRSFSGARDL